MQMLFPGEFNFYPQTWFLPEQYHQFVAEVSTKSKSKPDSNSSSTPSHNGMSTERRNSPGMIKNTVHCFFATSNIN